MTTRAPCLPLSIPLLLFAAAAHAADSPPTEEQSPSATAPVTTVVAQATVDAAAVPVVVAQASPETPPPAPTVIAQAAPPNNAASDSEPIAVEKIVVTSQKRAQDVQAVPVSISVLNATEMESQHLVNYEDLSRIIPGVSFNSGYAGEGLTNIVIRGISATGGSSTVGIYLDDVSIATKNFYDPGSASPRFLDFQGIEVLRGPQGQLYGDSSEGGTIRYISNQPQMFDRSGEVAGDVSFTKHGSVNWNTTGVLNLPVSPGLFALRGSVYVSSDSGWIDNYSFNQGSCTETLVQTYGACQSIAQTKGPLQAKGVNRESDFTFHLIGKLTPGNDWTITPTYFHQVAQTSDNAAFYPTLGLYEQDKEVQEPSHDKMDLATLSVKKSFEAFDFTSVSGWYRRDLNRQEDGTFFNSTAFGEFFLDPVLGPYNPVTMIPVLFPNGTPQQIANYQNFNDTVISNLPSTVHFHTTYHNISQELRLSSSEDSKSPLKWVAGAYYAQQTIHNLDFQQIPGIDTVFTGFYGFPLEANSQTINGAAAPGQTLFPNDIDESDDRTYVERQIAFFGQADYDLTPTWHFGLGARYTRTHEDFHSTEIGFYQIGNISPYYQEASFYSVTPKASVSHDVTANDKVYASIGEGFRSGGPTGPIVFGSEGVCNFDLTNIGQPSQPVKFDSDKLWTGELGSKNLLLDGRLTVDGALFYTKWSNIQQQIYLPTCGYYFTANVGDARIYGGELEAAWRVTNELRLTLALSAESATITSTKYPAVIAPGAHVVDVPDATLAAGVSYTIPFFSNYKLVSRANYSFIGHSYGSYQTNNSNYSNPGYGVLTLSATMVDKKSEFSVYAKNALNNQTIIQRPEINTVFEGYTVRPLTVGVTAKLKF
jgi:outer membrane receptor protein involved in Fe transport